MRCRGIALLVLAALAQAAPGQAVPGQAERASLRALFGEAPLVVHAEVERLEARDGDRLWIHWLKVKEVFRGEPPRQLAMVEFVGGAPRRDEIRAGDRVLVALEPAPTQSYYRRVLAGVRGFVPVGRHTVLRLAAEDVRRVAEGLGVVPSEPALAPRERAFLNLASGIPALVADGGQQLRRLEALAPLSESELAVLATVLRDPALPAFVARDLMQVLGERRLSGTLPLLVVQSRSAEPMRARAALAARVRLGAGATHEELLALAGAASPPLRRVLVAALAQSPGADGAESLARLARSDSDPEVRLAAVEALSQRREPEVLPALAAGLGDSDRAVRQGSARALLAQGPAADETLLALALGGPDPEARRHAALVLMVSRDADDPMLQRLREPGVPPEVTRLLEQGIRLRHSHAAR